MELDCYDFYAAGYITDADCCIDCHYSKAYPHLVMPPRRKQATPEWIIYHVSRQKHLLIADVCCRVARKVKLLKREDWVKVVKHAKKNGRPSRMPPHITGITDVPEYE